MSIIATSALTVLSLAALVISVITLNILLRVQKVSPAELAKNIHLLASDVQDLYDRVDHWQRRDRVRTLRAGREANVAPSTPLPGTPEYKQALRARANLTPLEGVAS